MNNIKTARTNAGLSQKEIAITLGVSVPTVSDWESGKKFPSGKNLVKLSQVLHTSTDFLLGCEGQKKEPPAHGGKPLDPVTRELLEIVGTSTPAEREMMLDMIRIIKKQRKE